MGTNMPKTAAHSTGFQNSIEILSVTSNSLGHELADAGCCWPARTQPLIVMQNDRFVERTGEENVRENLNTALESARQLLATW
jgi:hypothetical protein